jgi:TonB family protein
VNAKSSRQTGTRRALPEWVAPAAVILVLLLLVGTLLWHLLFKDPATTRRPVADTPMLALPAPPPPPPPPPEPEPEPKLEEEPMPEPEPFEEAPTPAAEEAPTPADASDPVTMDADAQAGTDSWGIQKGSGGGSIGTGTGTGGGAGNAGNASYGRYLGYILQQAIARDTRVRRHAFQLQVDIWLEPDGTLSRAELVRGSGNQEADEAVLDALRKLGKIDERPPLSLTFPARVLVQGRRPG